MQGFILKKIPQKNDHLIVQILSQNSIKSLWRFYGARHPILQVGKKIDFEIEYSSNFMPRLRSVYGLNFIYESNVHKSLQWEKFITLLSEHFLEVFNIPNFYFDVLDRGARKMELQNPKRVILEIYAQILHFEGRISKIKDCLICGKNIESNAALIRGFLLAHGHCAQGAQTFNKDKIYNFLSSQSTIALNDDEVSKLFNVLLLGI